MTLRLATPADSALLAAFDCVAGGQHHETEERDWLAATAIGWLELPIDPRLLLLEDDAGLVGFGAHEVFDIDEPTSGRYVNALGVDVRAQGCGIGKRLLQTVYEDCASLCPQGVIVWRVHPANHMMQAMCQSLGFTEWSQPPESAPYLRYVADLP